MTYPCTAHAWSAYGERSEIPSCLKPQLHSPPKASFIRVPRPLTRVPCVTNEFLTTKNNEHEKISPSSGSQLPAFASSYFVHFYLNFPSTVLPSGNSIPHPLICLFGIQLSNTLGFLPSPESRPKAVAYPNTSSTLFRTQCSTSIQPLGCASSIPLRLRSSWRRRARIFVDCSGGL